MTTIGSLCSGYGGLDLAAEAVFGARTVWHCEIEAAPSKVLAHRWPGVPNLGDLTAADWTAVEPVDVMTAGYPCQPFSHAGQRKGTDDERHLWPYVAEAVRGVRPRHVVLENVAGHRSLGFDVVLGDLAALGYDAQWTSIRASDVGAPHGRERIFILATDASGGPFPRTATAGDGLRLTTERRDRTAPNTQDDGRASLIASGRESAFAETAGDRSFTAADTYGNALRQQPVTEPRRGGTAIARLTDPDAPADADGGGLEGVGWIDTLGRDPHRRDSPDRPRDATEHATTADADLASGRVGVRLGETTGQGRQSQTETREGIRRDPGCGGRLVEWGNYEPAIRRWERLTRPAPAPTEPGVMSMGRIRYFADLFGIDGYTAHAMLAAGRWGQRLSPRFVEWMMGLPAGWVTDIPALSRNDQLRMLGNGVVPQQATAALCWLLDRIEAAA